MSFVVPVIKAGDEHTTEREIAVRVLVTGGAGFVGGNLCRDLATAGHDVVVLDDLSTGFRSNLAGLDTELVVGSIMDVDVLDKAAKNAESIVHLAALASVPCSVSNPGAANMVNVVGTLNVLQAARRAGSHVIVASSAAVYGANPTLPKHENLVPEPMSPYAVSKLAAESYALAFQETYGLRSLALRFFNIYGPLQSVHHAYAAVVPSFVSAMRDGKPLVVFGDGLQSRDFTSIGSVTPILVDAITRRVTHPRPINLAFGTSTTLLDLIDRLRDLTRLETKIDWQPVRSGDIHTSQAENSSLRALFPSAKSETLEDGLRRTLNWFAETDGQQW